MGSPPQQQIAQQIEQAPIPTPSPGVTQTRQEVVQAEQDFAKENLLKKSIKKTILAGDTGGFGGSPNNPFASQQAGPAALKGKLG